MTADPISTVESLLAVLPIPVVGRDCYVGTEPLDPQDALEDSPLVAGGRLTIGVPGEATRAVPGALAGVLRVIRGPDAGFSFPVPPGGVTVGRSVQDDVRLTDPLVSRSHATLHVTRDAVRVADNGSANGTEVGGSRISGTATLSPGSHLQVGDDVLEFHPVPGPALVTTRSPDGRLEFDRGYAAAPPRGGGGGGCVGALDPRPPRRRSDRGRRPVGAHQFQRREGDARRHSRS